MSEIEKIASTNSHDPKSPKSDQGTKVRHRFTLPPISSDLAVTAMIILMVVIMFAALAGVIILV